MNDELPRIQEQVYYGHINSQTDVLDKFLLESGTTRYNPQVNAFQNNFIRRLLLLVMMVHVFVLTCMFPYRLLLVENQGLLLCVHLLLEGKVS